MVDMFSECADSVLRSKIKSGLLNWIAAALAFLAVNPAMAYDVTPDHWQVGFRWQPYSRRPGNSIHDINREMGRKTSYATFWFIYPETVRFEKNADFENTPSDTAAAIRHAVRLCAERGIKTELIIMHIPLWINGGKDEDDVKKRPKDPQQIYDLTLKTARWFGDDVQYYGIYHEANIPTFYKGSDEELIHDFVLPATKAIRDYSKESGQKKVISTAGLSPSLNCKKWYKEQVRNEELMELIDNWAFNLSDHGNGYGGGLLARVSSCWDQIDYMRALLDENGYYNKGIVAAESWICWDGHRTPNGPESSGDTVEVTLKLFGECLQRGASLMNLPWCDNHSKWTMGMTKRLDYNGALQKLGEETFENAHGGAPILTRKLNIIGTDDKPEIRNDKDWEKDARFRSEYSVPNDPNHPHYYVWRWYAQLSAANHECIHHTYAGEEGNDIVLEGIDSNACYRVSSYDRTDERFIVLLAGNKDYESKERDREDDQEPEEEPAQTVKVTLPARILEGRYFNRDGRFAGEGFPDGQRYVVRWTTEDIDAPTGNSLDRQTGTSAVKVVRDGLIEAEISPVRRLTAIFFEKVK